MFENMVLYHVLGAHRTVEINLHGLVGVFNVVFRDKLAHIDVRFACGHGDIIDRAQWSGADRATEHK